MQGDETVFVDMPVPLCLMAFVRLVKLVVAPKLLIMYLLTVSNETLFRILRRLRMSFSNISFISRPSFSSLMR